MTANCYNDGYGIGARQIHEGYGLEKRGKNFDWYYTERGEKQYLHHFETEEEAVHFAYNQIITDKFANRHMIGFIAGQTLLNELHNELEVSKIKHFTDKIPYGGMDVPRYRVFVFGCDKVLVSDLKNKYLLIGTD